MGVAGDVGGEPGDLFGVLAGGGGALVTVPVLFVVGETGGGAGGNGGRNTLDLEAGGDEGQEGLVAQVFYGQAVKLDTPGLPDEFKIFGGVKQDVIESDGIKLGEADACAPGMVWISAKTGLLGNYFHDEVF